MKTIITLFKTRKLAREFALEKGMNTGSVMDLGTDKIVGERWGVKTEAVTLSKRKVTILTSGDGYHRPRKTVTVVTKTKRAYAIAA